MALIQIRRRTGGRHTAACMTQSAGPERVSEVIVYHDETEIVGQRCRGHVLFFVPRRIVVREEGTLFGTLETEHSPWASLGRKLDGLRESYNLDQKFHFSDLSGKKWCRCDEGTRAVISAGVEALRSSGGNEFRPPLNCKLGVILYPGSCRPGLFAGDKQERQYRYEETALRILLKGALHYLYGTEAPVRVVEIIADGTPAHRVLDADRVLVQILRDERSGRTALRDYVDLAFNTPIRHLSSDHKDHAEGSAERVHASILQVADLLLGSAVRACTLGVPSVVPVPRLGDCGVSKKDVIAYPVGEMLRKADRGAGFTKSGHYRSFTLSKMRFERGKPVFEKLDPMRRDPGSTCPSLFE